MAVLKRHPVLEVRDGYVICGGVHRTATLKLDPDKPAPAVGETHQMLRPIIHLGELSRAPERDIKAGDFIDEADDGSKIHVPGPVGQ
jgi:hypothetical protein